MRKQSTAHRENNLDGEGTAICSRALSARRIVEFGDAMWYGNMWDFPHAICRIERQLSTEAITSRRQPRYEAP
jgi:hypothetical protein